MDLLFIAFLTGFFGDAGLQLITKTGLAGDKGWGLKVYFDQHGTAEPLFTAGGMLTLFFGLYRLTGLKINYLNMFIYGILLDLAFRLFRIFPSLDGYYDYLNYFWSGLWQGLVMCLVLFNEQLYTSIFR